MRTWLLGLFAFLAPTVAAASERCVLDSRAGIEAADADAATDFVCAEVEKHLSGGPWHVKLGKLGSQVVVTLEGTGVREQLVLSNIEEIPVAAPRLVDAIGQRRPVVETMDVTNVVGGETRVPKKRPSEAHGTLMPVVLVMPGLGTSGGARVGLSFGAGRWTFGTDTTLAGYSFTGVMNVFGNAFHSSYESDKDIVKNPGIGYAALAAGARFHFTDSDTTPFVGGGIALMYEGHSVATSSYYDREHAANFGGAAFGEIGLEIARTRQFGATIGARIDAPAYTITTTTLTPSGNGYTTAQTAAYVPVMTFGVGLRL
jgi:hypothetical protein